MKKFLVIPDIHGRTFWKNAVDRDLSEFEKIIFLGDYLDPYPFEHISVPDAISNFKEIIDFKKNNNDKVILLLGNHDYYYFVEMSGPSRWSAQYSSEIEKIFKDNRNLFSLAYQSDSTLFTHSGLNMDWVNFYGLKNDADSLNSILEKINEDENSPYYSIMETVSYERGGRFQFGSCIWGDVHDFDDNNIGNVYQVFGHTLRLNTDKYYQTYNDNDISDGEPIFEKKYAMLDCRHAFIYTEDDRNFEMIF